MDDWQDFLLRDLKVVVSCNKPTLFRNKIQDFK